MLDREYSHSTIFETCLDGLRRSIDEFPDRSTGRAASKAAYARPHMGFGVRESFLRYARYMTLREPFAGTSRATAAVLTTNQHYPRASSR